MADIVSKRETHILLADIDGLYPSEHIFPSNDLFPKDAGLTDISNIVLGSLKLDERISEKIPQFGQLYASKFECKVYLTEDVQGRYLQVYQLDDDVYIPLFTGIIDSCKLDRLGTDRTIVAYDFAYTKGQINVAPWWEDFWSIRETATLKAARDSMLDWAGISYENVSLPNDNIEITKTVSISSCTLTNMLKMMCEISYCFPHFNRMGQLQFIMLNTDPEETTDLSNRYEWANSTFEDFETSEIDGVQFYDSGNQLKWTVGDTDNAYPIKKNIFLYEKSTELLNQIGEDIFDYLSEFHYTPAKVKMIVSDWGLDLGNYVHTEKGNFYVLHNSYSGSQFFEQSIQADGQETLYSGTQHLDYGELVLDEKIARVNFTVEQFQIEYGDFKNQTNSKFTQTAEAISTEVTRATTKETIITNDLANEVSRATGAENSLSTRITTETTTLSSRITQTADAITAEVTRATETEEAMFANYVGTVVPKTINAPANTWTTTALKQQHVGETYYNKTTKQYYRWTATTSGSTTTYSWKAIDTAAARSYSVVSSAIKQTADSITSEVSRAKTAETTLTTNLGNETTRATNAESALATRITTETSNLSSRITQTASDITSEVTRATEVEESMFANYVGTVVPTDSNAPASSWNTAAKKAAHVGETYYNKTTKKYYRWTATTSSGTTTYSWQNIDLTNKRTYEVVSSIIKQTADSITSEISRASSAEGDLSSRITQTADSISSEITRATQAEGSLSTRITQTDSAISSEVSRATATEGYLDSRITQTANSISLDVTNGETSSTIVLKLGETQLSSKTIQMTGLVTFTNLSTSGQTTINGGNITTGTIDASQVSVTNLNADNITSGTISADKIQGGQLTIDAESGYTNAIVVRRNNVDYVTINQQDGIKVSGYGGNTISLSGTDGLRVGWGSFYGLQLTGSSSGGTLTIGTYSDRTAITNGSIEAKSLTLKDSSIKLGNDTFSSTTGYLIEGQGYTAPTFSEIKDVDLDDSNLWAVSSYSAPIMKGNYSDGYNFSSSPTWKKISLSKSSYSTKIYGMSCGYSGPTISSKSILAK